MIKFEKVSFEEYYEFYKKMQRADSDAGIQWDMDADLIYAEWEAIKLPKRGTDGSAGYDFYAPYRMQFDRYSSKYQVFPTGIKFITDRNDIFLLCLPRSGQGFKYQLRLANTAGVIDSDYWYSDNQGHIMVKAVTSEDCIIEAGQAFYARYNCTFLKD